MPFYTKIFIGSTNSSKYFQKKKNQPATNKKFKNGQKIPSMAGATPFVFDAPQQTDRIEIFHTRITQSSTICQNACSM